jgi:leucyl/phenylalanyl-tRNA--protein transferase
VAVGGDFEIGLLIEAYRSGIFPWPCTGSPLTWHCPLQRAVIDFRHLHVPKRLLRQRASCKWTFTINKAFDSVIEACRLIARRGQDDTWITPALQSSFVSLHRLGMAHSVEVWDGTGDLVGGLYGVDAGGLFTGESMFHRHSGASKLALLHLIEHLEQNGADWIDVQMMTPHMAMLGAELIPRHAFLRRLRETQSRRLVLFDDVSHQSWR